VKPETIPFAVRLPREAREALIKAGESEERPAAWIAQRAMAQNKRMARMITRLLLDITLRLRLE
jgi:hypothetical protein